MSSDDVSLPPYRASVPPYLTTRFSTAFCTFFGV